MNWYYVDAGQQAGPVDDAQLAQLVAIGKIQPDTLVWHDGMASWQAYREVAPVSGASAGGPPVIGPISGATPYYAPIGTAVGGGLSQDELLARDYDVDIGDSLSRAWEVFKANAGLIIGASLLVYLAILAAGIIPYLGVVVGLLLDGPLMAGLWVFYLKNVRNQPATIGDAFSGFNPRFWQLVLTYLIPALITIAIIILLGIVAVPPVILAIKHKGAHASAMAPAMIAFIGFLVLVGTVVVTFLSTCWLFALPLAADKGLDFWPALELSRRMVMKHWWMTFWLLVVCSIVATLGILACGVGLLVTAPVAFAALAVHYQRVFGDLAPQAP